jgi:AAA domain
VLTGWVDAHGEEHPFSFIDMAILERTLQEYNPRLLIIDPVQAYLGAGVDMHRANETRPLLEALRRLAEKYEVAIACIRHPAKSHQGGKALHRGLGSVDFIGAARTGLFVEQHPTEPGLALLAQTKSNIGPLGRTQVFGKDHGEFHWHGVSRFSAEMLAGSGRGPDPYAFLEAVSWLEERLHEGFQVPSADLVKDAAEEGLTLPTLRRAKKALGVTSVKVGETWDWQLPAMRAITPPTPLLSLAPKDILEHVPPHQAVSGVTHEDLPALRQPGEDDAPQPGEDGYVPPGEVVENMEDVQETQEAHAPEETPAPAVPSVPAGIRKCHHCKKPVTWVLRGGLPFCSKCRTPDFRAR